MKRRTLLKLALGATVVPARAFAQPKPVRIGVLNDMSSVYSDFQGPGSVLAAQMAVEDFGDVEPQGGGDLRRTDVCGCPLTFALAPFSCEPRAACVCPRLFSFATIRELGWGTRWGSACQSSFTSSARVRSPPSRSRYGIRTAAGST